MTFQPLAFFKNYVILRINNISVIFMNAAIKIQKVDGNDVSHGNVKSAYVRAMHGFNHIGFSDIANLGYLNRSESCVKGHLIV